MEGLPVVSRLAEDYGTLFTAELERAFVLDELALAVCIDLSKANESVRLDLLEFLLQGNGMPSQVWRPMLDMARDPRRLKVMTAVGGWGDPTAGIVPGCSAATFIMALLLEQWRQGLGQGSPTARIRCWVDDSTAWSRGIAEGLAVWAGAARGMEDLEQGGGVKVNRRKSGVVVSHKCLQQLVRQATAERKRSLPGLVAGFGAEEPADWEQVW